MTYRSAFLRAYLRGGDACRAGLPLAANPYRRVGALHRARRGSWSEAFTRAWALGWRAEEEKR